MAGLNGFPLSGRVMVVNLKLPPLGIPPRSRGGGCQSLVNQHIPASSVPARISNYCSGRGGYHTESRRKPTTLVLSLTQVSGVQSWVTDQQGPQRQSRYEDHGTPCLASESPEDRLGTTSTGHEDPHQFVLEQADGPHDGSCCAQVWW